MAPSPAAPTPTPVASPSPPADPTPTPAATQTPSPAAPTPTPVATPSPPADPTPTPAATQTPSTTPAATPAATPAPVDSPTPVATPSPPTNQSPPPDQSPPSDQSPPAQQSPPTNLQQQSPPTDQSPPSSPSQADLLAAWMNYMQSVGGDTSTLPSNWMQLLAAAEAPFSDPFLMEFEDPQAVQAAYGGTGASPTPTFEQALMQARLEARQTAQACSQPLTNLARGAQSGMVKSVAMDGTSTLSQAMGNLIDAEPMADSSGASPGLPVVRTARVRTAADAEVPAEPATSMPGANRFAGVRRLPPTTPVTNPNGINVRVFGVVQQQQQQPPSRQRSEPKCFTLAHNYGYANLSTPHYLAVKNTANKGACCNLCQGDPRCVAWTRVAGGRADVRTCYLKDTFQRDPDLAAYTYSYAPPQLMHDYPQVRYIVDTQPVILESGTKQAALPANLYGCPYPPAPGQPAGSCIQPQTCNCYQGICYGSCAGGLTSK
ncbi:hypothetical protein COCOBI_05-6170 [Coccomyxa sp. Obi]|nr:hypothetical protein COCOBI_05-6170 [Coccomyxa sp. Obi]